MQAGILESDRVLTVSPYYAQELVSGEQRGVELDDTLRRSGVTGIVNGMDVNEWNPSTDKYISVNYDASTVRIVPLNLCCATFFSFVFVTEHSRKRLINVTGDGCEGAQQGSITG